MKPTKKYKKLERRIKAYEDYERKEAYTKPGSLNGRR